MDAAVRAVKTGARPESLPPGILHELLRQYAADKASFQNKLLLLELITELFRDPQHRCSARIDALALAMELRVYRFAGIFAALGVDPETPDVYVLEDSDVQLLVAWEDGYVHYSYLR